MIVNFFTHEEFNVGLNRVTMPPVIHIHLEDPEFNPIHYEENGDWLDLRSAETVALEPGESAMISFGCSMKLPEGYEAHLLPRSSTFKKYHVIQTNGMGVIDNSYSGTNDIWKMSVYATEPTVIHRGDRIAQFRLVETMNTMFYRPPMPGFSMGDPTLIFVIEDSLDSIDRGGFGSTGN